MAWLRGCARVAALSRSTLSRRSERDTGTRARAARSAALSGATEGPEAAAAARSPAASMTGEPADSTPPPTTAAVASEASPPVMVALRRNRRPAVRPEVARGAAWLPRCDPPVVRGVVRSPRSPETARWDARCEELTGESSRCRRQVRGAAVALEHRDVPRASRVARSRNDHDSLPKFGEGRQNNGPENPRCERNNSHLWSQKS